MSLKAEIYKRIREVFGFDGEIQFYSKYDLDSPDFMEYDENKAFLDAEYAQADDKAKAFAAALHAMD